MGGKLEACYVALFVQGLGRYLLSAGAVTVLPISKGISRPPWPFNACLEMSLPHSCRCLAVLPNLLLRTLHSHPNNHWLALLNPWRLWSADLVLEMLSLSFLTLSRRSPT